MEVMAAVEELSCLWKIVVTVENWEKNLKM